MVLYIVNDLDDADALLEMGVLAAAAAEVGKLDESFAPVYRFLDLVIVTDASVLDHAWALQTARALFGMVASLKVVRLPAGDGNRVIHISDWLAAGGTRKKLERLAGEEKEWQPSEEDNLARVVPVAAVQPEGVEWLWYPYLPKSKLTLLEGDPGVGKSWLSLAVASAISLGSGLPGREPSKPAPVLLASAEDGLGDTIRPRLAAFGANIQNIHAIEGPLGFDDQGLRILGKFMQDLKPALIIVDPLVAYLGPAVDMHRANETRAVLSRLADISEKHAASILAVRHLAKGGALRPIYRGLGSIDITAACRSVMLAGCDPENPQKRALVHIKSNLAPLGPSVGYEIRDGRFFWTGESSLTARQILAAADGRQNSALEEAAGFLEERLRDGPVEASAVFKEAGDYGISEVTLRRAKVQMKIVSRREGETGKRGAGRFVWELPPADGL